MFVFDEGVFMNVSEPSAAQTFSFPSLPHSLSSPTFSLTCTLSLHNKEGRETDLGLSALNLLA